MTNLTAPLGLIPITMFGVLVWFSMFVVIMDGFVVASALILGFASVLYSLYFKGKVAD